MKDLYKRLHVPPDADDGAIRDAINRTDAESRAAAEYILLDPTRRVVYDRHHRLLTTVGQLRSRLALGLRPFWSRAHHSDFNVPFAAPRTPANLRPMDVVEATSRRGRRKSATALWIAIGVASTLLIVAWLVLRHH